MENKTSEIEKRIWDAACLLRGNIDASEYKHVILGLIFLKYLSDSFEIRYKELIEEGEGFEEDKDEYIKMGLFFVPEVARWSYISKYAHESSIGKIIDEAMQAIEKMNNSLDGVLPQNFARPELDKRRLGNIVDLFTNLKIHEKDRDLLGDVYGYCLKQFAEQEGKLAGEFYTPACIVKLLVEVLRPYNGRVYDPACGSGGMFVQSAKFIEEHVGQLNNISIYGQDSNATTLKLCKMNLAIRGLGANLGKYAADTFFDDQHPQLKADYIIANPPFNLSNWGGDKLVNDKRWVYGNPPNGNANYAWIQHMLHHLSPNGKIGLVLSNGALASQTAGEGEIRQKIIEADLVECIIALPPQLFSTTGIPVTLWFFNNNKTQKGKVLFIDARDMGVMKTRKLRELTDYEIKNIADKISIWQHDAVATKENAIGTLKMYQDLKGYCKEATLEDIKNENYILTPGRYVGVVESEEDSEPFEEKMPRLKKELFEMFDESNKLQAEIKKQLEKLVKEN